MVKVNLQDKNLYYIGGVVRDELLGKVSLDTDITYIGNAIEFVKSRADLKILQINESFGTVRVEADGQEIDIASTRNETYPKKGHLPEVYEIGCELKKDVLRRDFTINALAKSTLNNRIVDYVGGIDDIKNKKLRVLHDNSFIDDPTRIIRGLKFRARFGFELDNHTKLLQDKYLKNINYDMSYKRLKKELVETFNLNSNWIFEKFVNEKIYKLITPVDLEFEKFDYECLINKYKPMTIWIIYVGLIPEIEKLPLNKKEKKIVEDFNELKEYKFIDDFDIVKTFGKLELETIIMLSIYHYDIVVNYLENLKNINISITGNDLIDLGVSPSNKFRECFDYVLKHKLTNPNLSRSEEMKLAREFFGE